ncbi:hypothetical protein BLA17378_02188 [Burkholderia aenigmatica]|uniref:Uncharacterized protein n=1 Tax=Burkholderia aenigmatica TaxID=2015348 RepID=A0ABY6XTY9_9BURK|nr:hypothetical protein BLA17378_02188 [Burkholderia aenigmatica]
MASSKRRWNSKPHRTTVIAQRLQACRPGELSPSIRFGGSEYFVRHTARLLDVLQTARRAAHAVSGYVMFLAPERASANSAENPRSDTNLRSSRVLTEFHHHLCPLSCAGGARPTAAVMSALAVARKMLRIEHLTNAPEQRTMPSLGEARTSHESTQRHSRGLLRLFEEHPTPPTTQLQVGSSAAAQRAQRSSACPNIWSNDSRRSAAFHVQLSSQRGCS